MTKLFNGSYRDMNCKNQLTYVGKGFRRKHSWELFEREMLITTYPTNSLQIFFKIITYFQDMVRIIIVPDDNL